MDFTSEIILSPEKVQAAKALQKKQAAQASMAAQAGQAGQGQQAAENQPDNIGILGHVLWLMSQSAVHKHVFVSDFEWLVMPAILHGQFRIWREKNEQGVFIPVGYASWAFLSDDAEERIQENIKKLAPADWQSGDNLWLIDLITPFGGADNAVQELKKQIFEGRTIKSLQPKPGGGSAVAEW